MAGILSVNSVDMATHGLTVRRVEGHRSAPKHVWPVKVAPGATSGVFMASEPNVEPRTVRVYGTISGASHAGLLTNIAALKTALRTGSNLNVSFVDNATQKLVCRCTEIDIDDFDAGFIQRHVSVVIEFVAPNPDYVAV